MRPISRALVFLEVLLFVLSPQALRAQTRSAPGPPQPVRDAQALAVVQSAIAAMGGASAVGAIADATVQGTIQNQTTPASPTANFTWMISGREFRNQISDGVDMRIYVSNSGSPVDQRDGQNVSIPYFVAQANLPYQLPALVLLDQLNNPNYTISIVGPTVVDGTNVIQVHTCDGTNFTSYLVTPQDWYFNASTSVPVRVEYKLPKEYDAQDPWPLSIDFGNYQTTAGILVPYQLTMNEGPVIYVATVTSVAFNSGLSPSEFTAPTVRAQ